MRWNAIIFAAGRGRRMRNLTVDKAKPSLSIGKETLISRLVRQVTYSTNISQIYINCSYKAESIINSVAEKELPKTIQILWESEPMGTSRSLLTIASREKEGVVAIHGDLFLSDNWLDPILAGITADPKYSYVVVHSRNKNVARSEVVLDNNLVVSISKPHIKNCESIEQKVWSNSGIYLIKFDHLQGIDSQSLGDKEVVEGILKLLINRRLLKAIPFNGIRYSVETPEDLLALQYFIQNP